MMNLISKEGNLVLKVFRSMTLYPLPSVVPVIYEYKLSYSRIDVCICIGKRRRTCV